MNRKEANIYLGKKIRVVDPRLGNYIGELVDIITEPRKAWRGNVKIIAIEQYPAQSISDQKQIFTTPPFVNGKTYEMVGSKIEPITIEKELPLDFNESLIKALLKEINHYQTQKENVSLLLTNLKTELKKVNPLYEFNEIKDYDFQYYTVTTEKDSFYLADEHNHQIPLEECPFEFQIKVKGRWVDVQHDTELKFVDKNQKSYQVKVHSEIRLNKDQFDPYHLFINELEKPALDSLISGMEKFQMTHDDCVNCHNSLLNQYLASKDEKLFKGVNFITYQKAGVTLLVQHHYERDISDNGQDITYDRFEYTNDKGRRILMTYTTEKSK